MSSFDGRYAFIADWYDPNAALTRKYQLFYYPSDSTVEMVGSILNHDNNSVFFDLSLCILCNYYIIDFHLSFI
jgi:hypothetical protein